ncbi:MAG TPA: hypothetical protein VN345_13310 [Blastocatellia bacterium]|jgi:hypothetical protein|nr:hypothetical protein [Blastocatellia bacterium]
MSMTLQQYIERVYQRVSQGMPQDKAGLYRKTIEAQILDALQELADRTAQDPADRAILQKVYTVPMAGGIAPIQVGATSDLMPGFIQYVLHPNSSKPMQPLPWYTDLLTNKGNTLYYYYTVTANAIYGKKSDGVTNPEDANLTVQANFIPVLTSTSSTVPPKKEADLVAIGVELAMKKILGEPGLPQLPLANQ